MLVGPLIMQAESQCFGLLVVCLPFTTRNTGLGPDQMPGSGSLFLLNFAVVESTGRQLKADYLKTTLAR